MPAANPTRNKISPAVSPPGHSTYSYDPAGNLIREKHEFFRDLPPEVSYGESGRVACICHMRELVRVEEFDHRPEFDQVAGDAA